MFFVILNLIQDPSGKATNLACEMPKLVLVDKHKCFFYHLDFRLIKEAFIVFSKPPVVELILFLIKQKERIEGIADPD